MNLNNSLRKTPVAVIGLSAIFADAKNVEEFWTNIIQAKDSITDVPDSRWSIDDYYDADMTAPDKTYCKRGGFIPNVDFNPMEFGLPPNILEVTDASQLLGLVAARDALADAGYGKKSSKFTAELKAKTGVLLGVGGGQKLITPLIARLQYPIWERALRSSGIAEKDIPMIVDKMKKAYVGWNENSFPGLLGNVISGRITNRFDLGGINSVVDAACAASLSAIKMALSELVEGRCDMMLTGGVDTDNSPFMYMSFSKTPAFSKSGNISPFSDAADGMLIGEGLGMLVLKRLEDAERDGDKIYAVIKGVGTSSDGRFKSVYAPRSSGQALAMNRAYEEAGYAPSTVGLLEAHGTGTGAGDPTEFESMRMVFEANNPKKQHIALGSVKSQVGHTKAAAGAAGMIKAVLALHHKTLPPTINVAEPNSKFDIQNSPIYINTETRPWLRNGAPRRAGVSAFGFGGINVHIAMEEYKAEQKTTYRLHEPYKSILLQANTPVELLSICQDSLKKLQAEDAATTFLQLAEASKKIKLTAFAARLGFVATSLEEAKNLLQTAIQTLSTKTEAWEHPKGIFYRPNGMTTDGKVVALFSGQGSQYVGMGKEIANAFPQLRQSFQQADELFYKNNQAPLSSAVYPIPVFNKADKTAQQQVLTKTQNAQPAIGTMSMGLYKILKEAGFNPNFTAGHSFGELTALWAAGVYDDATFLALAKARGAAMAATNPNADSGTMLAVKAPFSQVEQEVKKLQGVSIANLNSNNQVVLGGSTAAIKAAEQHFKAQGITAIPLPVSAAFHTEFVQHAQKPFADFVAQQRFTSPAIPVYSNTTAQAYPNATVAIQSILKGQILKPVLFKNQVENIYQAGGRIFVEFGPKGVLTNLVKDILKGKDFTALALNPNARKDSDLQFRQAIVQLQVLGVSLTEVDKYKVPSIIPTKKTKLNVALGGHNYVSAGTQKAYTDVMNNGFKISGGTQTIEKTVIKEVEKIVEVPVEKIVEKIVEVPVTKVVEVPTNNIITQPQEEDMNNQVVQLLQSTLEHFKTQQTKSLEIFERFLNDQNLQSQQLLQMISQQLESAQSQTPTPPPSNSNGKSNGSSKGSNGNGNSHKIVPMSSEGAKNVLANIASIVSETPLYSSSTSATSQEVQTAVLEAPQVQAPEASTTSSSTGVGKAQLENILLTVISEKTGYPTEMLELDMDMEADLGIDSIKRVEIFGSMTESYPEVSGINPQELTELRTLGQIVDYIAAQSGGNVAISAAAPVVTTPAPVVAITEEIPTPAAPAPSSSNKAALENILLTVISEKTGYPTEMLELDMDMEADLGIDSIKRVEIFGSMTESYPEVSGINPQELTELRTLGQIVDYIAAQSGGSVAAIAPVAVAPAPVAKPTETASSAAPTSTGTNKKQLENILLTVISEKTGYPTEMLELDMDMEADLGIDSIKRVEIFGSMTESYPEVSGINPQELTELRTLGQIVDYIAAQSGGSVITSTPVAIAPAPVAKSTETASSAAPTSTGTNKKQLENILLTVISEKTGYPTEMLELDMDMEADLGIDSIKRVEIFGSMTESYPEVSGINPQELTELRTLGQIVDYIAAQGKKKVLVQA